MPIQITTDCGSELTVIHGVATALREAFAPGVDPRRRPHVFLRSLNNIKIERGWLDLRNQWGHNIPYFWKEGEGDFIEGNELHIYLVRFLWPKMIRHSLDKARELLNMHRMRKNPRKTLPSGCTPNEAYSLHARYGGEWCLQPVDVAVVRELMEFVCDGRDLMNDWGIPVEFEERATAALTSFGLRDDQLTEQNIWYVFRAMLERL